MFCLHCQCKQKNLEYLILVLLFRKFNPARNGRNIFLTLHWFLLRWFTSKVRCTFQHIAKSV